MRDYLEAEGFVVEHCSDGSEGLAAALSGRHALLVLDLMLPGTSGFDILRAYRTQWPHPVLIVSARGDDSNKIRGLGMGADDYLAKPFSPAELVARVKAHLARYRRLTGAEDPHVRELVVGPLRLDVERRLIRLRGETLALTAKEHEMLTLLVQNPGRLFSKEELYERVWGENNAGDQSTVATHVRRLREKVETDPADPRLIVTVWGLGYRLAE